MQLMQLVSSSIAGAGFGTVWHQHCGIAGCSTQIESWTCVLTKFRYALGIASVHTEPVTAINGKWKRWTGWKVEAKANRVDWEKVSSQTLCSSLVNRERTFERERERETMSCGNTLGLNTVNTVCLNCDGGVRESTRHKMHH